MAQSASLAEAKAQQARQNLENYVFGTSVSTVPPVVPPMLPRGAATYPAYPYANAPTQWPSNTVPLAQSSFMQGDILLICPFVNTKTTRINRFSEFL